MSDYGTPPPNQPPTGPTGPTGGVAPQGSPRKGFFGALFDFKFEHFVTPMIVKVVYILALVALVLTWLVLLVAGFAQGVGSGLAVLILGSVGVILYLCLIRMTLEFYLSIVRMSQDIHTRLR